VIQLWAAHSLQHT